MRYTSQHAQHALEIMERLLPHVTFRQEYQELIAILRDPIRWKEAYAQFIKIRRNITLPPESCEEGSLDQYFAYIAENAAKTAYHCSGGPAMFDKHSFLILLKCEQAFLERRRTHV